VGIYILGRTWEPDFIVTYRRQAAIIEVDGATHTKKWADDQSRDALFEDSGIKFVRHINVADAENPQRAAEFVDRFIGLFDG
jgi:very-short-patch-repair endonuclease